MQRRSLSDMALHETSLAWVQNQENLTLPPRPWAESRNAFATRTKRIVATINAHHDVDGLCREMPMRIRELIGKEGDKLRK